MGECHNGRTETDLQFALRYVWDTMAGILITGRSTLCVGAIGFRTDETSNPMQGEEGYENICTQQPLGSFKFPELKRLQKKVVLSSTDKGDAISAIIIAIDMMEKFTRKLKYIRKIVLVTNGTGLMDADGLEDTIEKLKEDDIELVVMGVDFDDAEFGFKQEDKDPQKRENEEILKGLVEKCEKGVFGTAAEAVHDISMPRTKEYRPYATFKGQLTLGDPYNYDTGLAIDVERYFRTKIAKPPTASSYVVAEMQGEVGVEDIDMEDVNLTTTGETLDSVKNQRTYRVDDPSAPGGKRDVDRDDLAMGYEYGRTAVAISESDQNVTKLETTPCFTILGFLPSEDYEEYFNMGESCITVGARMNDKARLAISSVARTMYEQGCCAVARIVLKEGKDPQLVLIAPHIEADLEALIDVPLPFAEDFRMYQFPPLDRVISTSGQTITKHRYLPTDPLKKAVSDYVESMDLGSAGVDENGNAEEYMKIEDTYSPVLHRIQQAIRLRAINPDATIQPPADILVKYSHPPEDLVNKAAVKKHIQHLITVADVKKVPPRAKGRKAKDVIKPLSGLDVDALLRIEHRTEIHAENAVPQFKQALGLANSEETIKEAAKQMGAIIKSLVENSVGDSGYARALEDMRAMREELVDFEMPVVYNDFLKQFKEEVLSGELGGDRREIWFEVRRENLGLISDKQSEVSEVTEEEAKEFYKASTGIPHRGKK